MTLNHPRAAGFVNGKTVDVKGGSGVILNPGQNGAAESGEIRHSYQAGTPRRREERGDVAVIPDSARTSFTDSFHREASA